MRPSNCVAAQLIAARTAGPVAAWGAAGPAPTHEGRMERYGWVHRQLRQEMIGDAWGRLCHFCKEPMLPGQPLDLDHHDDGKAYRGMTHRSCNRAAGARKGAAERRRKADPSIPDPRSADW